MDFDYKKYSLEKLETWVEDALNAAEASPQEIYDCIRKVVEDNYYCYKNQTSRCYELLELLNESVQFNVTQDPKKNLVSCGLGDTSEYCKNSWVDFWEEHYYPEESEKSKSYYDYNRNDLNRENPFKDKVKKWVLPVQVDGLTGDCFINLPDDLLEAANLKEGDKVEWVDNGDGSYLFKKVKEMTYDEAIAAGWTMTADGFWIKEN